MEKRAFLCSVQRIIGGVSIQHDLTTASRDRLDCLCQKQLLDTVFNQRIKPQISKTLRHLPKNSALAGHLAHKKQTPVTTEVSTLKIHRHFPSIVVLKCENFLLTLCHSDIGCGCGLNTFDHNGLRHQYRYFFAFVVESRSGAVTGITARSVSTPRSSNRTCGFDSASAHPKSTDSAPTSPFSRLARCSLMLWPACSLSRFTTLFPRCLNSFVASAAPSGGSGWSDLFPGGLGTECI